MNRLRRTPVRPRYAFDDCDQYHMHTTGSAMAASAASSSTGLPVNFTVRPCVQTRCAPPRRCLRTSLSEPPPGFSNIIARSGNHLGQNAVVAAGPVGNRFHVLRHLHNPGAVRRPDGEVVGTEGGRPVQAPLAPGVGVLPGREG